MEDRQLLWEGLPTAAIREPKTAGHQDPRTRNLEMIPVPQFFYLIADLVGREVEKLKGQQWSAL